MRRAGSSLCFLTIALEGYVISETHSVCHYARKVQVTGRAIGVFGTL
jgi:hypothetical protein